MYQVMNKKDRPTILILRKNNNNIKQILVNNIKQRWRKTWVTTSNITIKKRNLKVKPYLTPSSTPSLTLSPILKGQDILIQIKLTFMESVLGAKKVIEFSRKTICSTCKGDKNKHGF